ncbi:MAG: CDP-diacylglycerol--glycerol-3-phosphate 3-phosphatidyltransferase [Oscillospiraceae bacterium]|nr:CDP-diacylglycerol--glycerol-3-phosphate 3-phosphatidyltransferase [Oscillospiraceae bacterium]
MNIPNKITLFRIILVPFFIFFAAFDFVKNSGIWGLVVFAIASLSDCLDGYLARKNNTITDFGKLMDPLADKILVVSALIILSTQGFINNILVIIIISRDFIIDSIRLLASNQGKVIAADIWGKLKTVFQMIAIIVFLVYKAFKNILLEYILSYIKCFGSFLIYIATILTIFSAVNYIIKNYEYFKIK